MPVSLDLELVAEAATAQFYACREADQPWLCAATLELLCCLGRLPEPGDIADVVEAASDAWLVTRLAELMSEASLTHEKPTLEAAGSSPRRPSMLASMMSRFRRATAAAAKPVPPSAPPAGPPGTKEAIAAARVITLDARPALQVVHLAQVMSASTPPRTVVSDSELAWAWATHEPGACPVLRHTSECPECSLRLGEAQVRSAMKPGTSQLAVNCPICGERSKFCPRFQVSNSRGGTPSGGATLDVEYLSPAALAVQLENALTRWTALDMRERVPAVWWNLFRYAVGEGLPTSAFFVGLATAGEPLLRGEEDLRALVVACKVVGAVLQSA